VRGYGVFSANMGVKLLVALQLEAPHHFIKGIARGRSRGIEHPCAGGAPVTAKTAFFYPNELAYCRHLSLTLDGRLSFEWQHLPHETQQIRQRTLLKEQRIGLGRGA